MKKVFAVLLFLFSLIFVFSVSASTPAPNIEVNGVKVYSPYNNVKKEEVFVDVEAFFTVLNQEMIMNHTKKMVLFEGKTVPFKNYKKGFVSSIKDLEKLIKDAGYSTKLTKEKDGSVYLLVLPKGVVQITPSVPKMGEHWARPKDMPMGPIYGVENGKLVFIEQMPAHEFFLKGQSLVDLDGMRGLPSPGINHTNIEFQKNGHEGFEEDHYDIHHYFITPKERDAIKGDPIFHGSH